MQVLMPQMEIVWWKGIEYHLQNSSYWKKIGWLPKVLTNIVHSIILYLVI